jgi:hypothetical protein
MVTMKKMIIGNEKGFALIAAIIACLILLAVGMLVINMTAGDLFTSSATVGNKKALAATESGIHRVIQDFNPDPSTWIAANNYTDCTVNSPSYIWRPINSGTDANTQFAVCTPTASNLPPLPAAGSPLGGGGGSASGYSYHRYNSSVVGKSTSNNSQTSVDIGLGFGPI